MDHKARVRPWGREESTLPTYSSVAYYQGPTTGLLLDVSQQPQRAEERQVPAAMHPGNERPPQPQVPQTERKDYIQETEERDECEI